MDNKLILLEKNLQKLISTPCGRRVFLGSLPLLLAGCATAPKSRYREGDNKGQDSMLSVADERKMTAEYLPQMSKEYPTLKNSYAQDYIQALGGKVVNANGLSGKPYNYNFRVVKSSLINAFALPAGEVFITSELIKTAGSEAELAGVVGHEVGHIQARHTAERLTKAEKEKGKQLLYGLGGALLGGAAGYALGKKLCSQDDRECLARVATYGAAAGGAGGLLIQKFAFMAHSREDEMEADRIGFKTALNAGYDKNTIGLFYEKLLQMEKVHKNGGNKLTRAFSDALSTHPPSQERVDQMNAMARSAIPVGTVKTTTSFSRVQGLM